MARQVKGWLIAYLIGVFDGEGCVAISPGSRKYRERLHCHIQASVQMTNEYLPRLFQGTYGGRVYFSSRTGNHNDVWKWMLSNQQARPLLEDIVKYGILKKPQAEVALRLLNLQRANRRGHPISEGEKVLREADSILMHQLNKRGR